MNMSFRIFLLAAVVFYLVGVAAQGATFIPIADAMIWDGLFEASKDGVADHISDGVVLGVHNVVSSEARSVIEFAPNPLSGSVTSARLVLPIYRANGPFPIQVDLYAYPADGVVSLSDFGAGTFVATINYSNQSRLVFDVTDVLSGLWGLPAGFNLRVRDVSPISLNGPFVSFNSLEEFLYRRAEPPVLLINDTDGDGVEDGFDQCPDTRAGARVNDAGCGIEQLCPCDGSWLNRSEYLRCVKRSVREFLDAGDITEDEARAFLKQAIRSDCGR